MVKRILAVVGLIIGGVLYVWYAAVRAVPAVRRRKAAMRAGTLPRRKSR